MFIGQRYRKMMILFGFSLFLISTAVLFGLQARAAEPVGKFTLVEGKVDVLRGGAMPALSVKTGEPVFVKDVVRTKSSSKAEILFVDGNQIKIGQRTRIDISEYISDEKKSVGVIKLPRGTVEAIVPPKVVDRIKLSPEANRFEIQTPVAVAAVRGCEYKVYQSGNSATIYVTEGVIYVVNPRFPGQVIEVHAGEIVTIYADQPATASKPRKATEEERKMFDRLALLDEPSGVLDFSIMTQPPGPGTSTQPPITETFPGIIQRPSGPIRQAPY
ncbi:MAG: FecR domain-containing protein [Deltaproteobacteria bacterium]|nr:FecR domain-containing protein [Deltaproteobacteria bacterium]